MKKTNLFVSILLFMMVFLSLPLGIHADMGPKPSVRVTLKNLPDGEAYVTLLSETRTTGPHSAFDGEAFPSPEDYEEENYYETPYDVLLAFTTYSDADGYYFLQQTERHVEEEGEYIWGYYPPQKFKVLLYFPDEGRFVVSEAAERYAFHSYFTGRVSGNSISIRTSYDYKAEVIGLTMRIGITLLVELLLALLFFAKERKLLLPIAIFNVVTQILLNLWLAKINYQNGGLAFTLQYIGLEIAVTAIEAALLLIFAPRLARAAKRIRLRVILYAITANLASLLFGLWISDFFPTWF